MIYLILTVLGALSVFLLKSHWTERQRIVFIVSMLLGGVVLSVLSEWVFFPDDVISKGEGDDLPSWLEPMMYFVTLAGMGGKLAIDSIDSGKGFTYLVQKEFLVKPIIISPIVFAILYGAVGSAVPVSFLLIFAFQNGFFWQTVLTRDGPSYAPFPLPSISSNGSSPVFIIHGHDLHNLQHLTNLLKEKWDLQPIILAHEPGRGRTIIEKFLDEAQSAIFAIALLTPDDAVTIADTHYAQARPNVTFELGWFYGRLGRERVCILFQEGTKIHSDLDGISRIEFEKSVNEESVILGIARDLAAAGVIERRN